MSSPQTTTDLLAIAEALRAGDRFLVVSHENADGDALGSLLAMALALRQLGKDAQMYLSGDTPVPRERMTGRWVYDLVYNPSITRLLREAAEVGCQTIGGLEMLVAQAHEQFQWWTGTRPQAGVMREAALKRLAECARDEHHLV